MTLSAHHVNLKMQIGRDQLMTVVSWTHVLFGSMHCINIKITSAALPEELQGPDILRAFSTRVWKVTHLEKEFGRAGPHFGATVSICGDGVGEIKSEAIFASQRSPSL